MKKHTVILFILGIVCILGVSSIFFSNGRGMEEHRYGLAETISDSDFSTIPYRTEDRVGSNGQVIPANSSILKVILDAKSGAQMYGINGVAYFPVFSCYAPAIRNGVLAAQCETFDGAKVHITATPNTLESLMSLNSDFMNKGTRYYEKAALVARYIGMYGNSPMFRVLKS